MGRRSINTTKSGKYMNPTDQARKEARKKELKKNKKQRQMVRAAVLKGKDPHQILMELEKIDQMEYNVMQPSPLNEKVLKDKRKKLKDTLDRVLRMYNKDDPDKWVELKRMQVDYERKKTALFNYYEAVKNAQQVSVDEIPLPLTSLSAELQAVLVNMPSQIPLPAHAPPGMRPPVLLPSFLQPHHSILKKTSAYMTKDLDRTKEPPGVPVGPPPDLSDDEEPMEQDEPVAPELQPQIRQKTIRFADEADARPPRSSDPSDARLKLPEVPPGTENEEEEAEEEEDGGGAGEGGEEDDKPRPTSLQQRMLAMAGQDIDQFMREMEEVHKKRKADRAADLENRLQALEKSGKGPEKKRDESPPPPGTTAIPVGVPLTATISATEPVGPALTVPVPRGAAVTMTIPGMPPIMFRPPPPALMGIRLPPGPPPGLPPRLGIRLPPGPPPGMPPRMMRPNLPPPPGTAPILPPHPTNVLSAAPQLISRPPADKTSATIQANAQIRNLSADVTRFLPTALRTRRDPKRDKKDMRPHQPIDLKPEVSQPPAKMQQTKDDAYMQFMREMEGLI